MIGPLDGMQLRSAGLLRLLQDGGHPSEIGAVISIIFQTQSGVCDVKLRNEFPFYFVSLLFHSHRPAPPLAWR